MKTAELLAVLLFAFAFTSQPVYSQKNKANISIADLADRMAKTPKPIVLYLYTNWCAYCKLQEQQIKKDTALQDYLNKNYYYFSLNAESKASIIFNKKTYNYQANGLSGGLNEIALLGLKKSEPIAFPLWLIFDSNYQLLYRKSGLLPVSELKTMLNPNKNGTSLLR